MKVSLYILILFPLFSLSVLAESELCLENSECRPSLECRVFKCVAIKLEEQQIKEFKVKSEKKVKLKKL